MTATAVNILLIGPDAEARIEGVRNLPRSIGEAVRPFEERPPVFRELHGAAEEPAAAERIDGLLDGGDSLRLVRAQACGLVAVAAPAAAQAAQDEQRPDREPHVRDSRLSAITACCAELAVAVASTAIATPSQEAAVA